MWMEEAFMTLEELKSKYPVIIPYIEHMPEELKKKYTVRVFPPGHIIHQKHYLLDYFGIVCSGSNRVVNEFENGNMFMIEKNDAIDFIGEVTILAGMKETSVTIETMTESVVLMISRKDFEHWISQDIWFLRQVTQKVAFKLYRSSYNNGAKLFYPPNFLLLDYLLKYAKEYNLQKNKSISVKKTRQQLYEELGITVKTLNRTIYKLKEEELISVEKGKIVMSYDQYERAKKEIKYYIKGN